MSRTPRTDEFFKYRRTISENLDFARQLETELNDAKEALSGRTVSCSNCNESARQIAELKADNTGLLERLRERTESHLAASARDVQDNQRLRVENTALREIIKRARDMIDVSPDSPPNEWPSTDQINQLVKDCDETAKSGGHESKSCDWKQDDDGNWDTSCKQCMSFEHAPPFEQGYIFCHHCGLTINFIHQA